MTSPLEAKLLMQVRAAGLPTPQREVCVIPGRRFRLDLGWVEHRLGCEVEGGLYRGRSGRRGAGHTSTSQILRDCEKHSLLAVHGWRLIRATEKTISDGRAVAWIEAALARDPSVVDPERSLAEAVAKVRGRA